MGIMRRRQRTSDNNDRSPPPYIPKEDAKKQRVLLSRLRQRTNELRLSDVPEEGSPDHLPTPDEAWAHLKLLQAIRTLHETISNIDGLFGLHDEDVTVPAEASISRATNEDRTDAGGGRLAQLRDRRWSICIARAAKRFETWWEALRDQTGAGSLTFQTNLKIRNHAAQDWRNGHLKRLVVTQEKLPPLDVLMVWHAFMLNPRNYLEDCLRQDMMCLWWTGMPWAALHASLSADGIYEPGDEARKNFETLTNLPWQNLDGSGTASVRCSRQSCRMVNEIPWSMVDRDAVRAWAEGGNPEVGFMEGRSYAEPELAWNCTACDDLITQESLCVAKLMDDCRRLRDDRPLSGTILDATGSMSTEYSIDDQRLATDQMFDRVIRAQDEEITWKSMSDVRQSLDLALYQYHAQLDASNSRQHPQATLKLRQMIAKVLSHYNANSTPFALSLAPSVHRQGNFIAKMTDIDFIHSPYCFATLARLTVKYERFMFIMSSDLSKISVPTLDVDLMWHTNQLSPARYYGLCMRTTQATEGIDGKRSRGIFIDHDDKIGEGTLSTAFEETGVRYEKAFGEQYAACTCQACEAESAVDHPATSMLWEGVGGSYLHLRTEYPNSRGERGWLRPWAKSKLKVGRMDKARGGAMGGVS